MIWLFITLFLVCWTVSFILIITGFTYQIRLYRYLKKHHPTIRNTYFRLNPYKGDKLFRIIAAFPSFFKALISFGNSKYIEQLIYVYTDVTAIKHLKDEAAKNMLRKLTRFLSAYIKCWVVMALSIIIVGIIAIATDNHDPALPPDFPEELLHHP